jgi:phosphate transport system protein
MQINLKEHTVKSFDKNLQKISNLIIQMSNLCVKSVKIVEESMSLDSEDNLKKINDHDKKINEYDHKIGNEVVAFIALRQPKASDLRFLVSAIKVSANLERIGDYAKSVIKKLSKNKVSAENYKNLLKMTSLAKEMIIDSVDALVNNDLENSKKIQKQDDEIDEIYRQIFSSLESNEGDTKDLMYSLLIAKSIERLADHAVNVAEIVHYNVTGEII